MIINFFPFYHFGRHYFQASLHPKSVSLREEVEEQFKKDTYGTEGLILAN